MRRRCSHHHHRLNNVTTAQRWWRQVLPTGDNGRNTRSRLEQRRSHAHLIMQCWYWFPCYVLRFWEIEPAWRPFTAHSDYKRDSLSKVEQVHERTKANTFSSVGLARMWATCLVGCMTAIDVTNGKRAVTFNGVMTCVTPKSSEKFNNWNEKMFQNVKTSKMSSRHYLPWPMAGWLSIDWRSLSTTHSADSILKVKTTLDLVSYFAAVNQTCLSS